MKRSAFLLDRTEIGLFAWWAIAAILVGLVRTTFNVQFVSLTGQISPGTVAADYFSIWTLRDEYGPPFSPIGRLIDGAIWGAVAALPQWLLLRRRMPDAGQWIVATSVGVALAYVVSAGTLFIWPKEQHFINESQTTFSYRPIAGFQFATAILSAATAAAFQYLVFRRHYARAYLWPLAVVAVSAVAVFAPGYSQLIVFAVITAYCVPLVLRQPLDAIRGATMQSVPQDIDASVAERFGYSKLWKTNRVAAAAYPFIVLLAILAYWVLLVAPGDAEFRWWVPLLVMGALAWAVVAIVNVRKTLRYRVDLSPTGIRVNDAAALWSDVAKVDLIAAIGDRPSIVLHTKSGGVLSVAAATDSFAYVQGFIEGHTKHAQLS